MTLLNVYYGCWNIGKAYLVYSYFNISDTYYKFKLLNSWWNSPNDISVDDYFKWLSNLSFNLWTIINGTLSIYELIIYNGRGKTNVY